MIMGVNYCCENDISNVHEVYMYEVSLLNTIIGVIQTMYQK